jgi:Domain of unknown function (DUF6378)
MNHDATRRPQSRFAAGEVEAHSLPITMFDEHEALTFHSLPDVDTILAERGKRYGKFTDHAEATQALKRIVMQYIHVNTTKFSDDQIEALEMICHKIGRIINGDPDYADSWVDIAGYAKLVADRLEGIER